MRKLASVAIIFICFACEKTDKSQALQFNHNTAPIKIELPNTPETVVRAWEEKINKNDFAFARLISVGNTLTFVNSLSVSNDIEHPADIHSEVINIQCAEKNDSALCKCILKDEYGKAAFNYSLARYDGQWLIRDVVPDEEQAAPIPMPKKTTKTIQ